MQLMGSPAGVRQRVHNRPRPSLRHRRARYAAEDYTRKMERELAEKDARKAQLAREKRDREDQARKGRGIKGLLGKVKGLLFRKVI